MSKGRVIGGRRFLPVVIAAAVLGFCATAVAGDAAAAKQRGLSETALARRFHETADKQKLLREARRSLAWQQVLQKTLRTRYRAEKRRISRLRERVGSREGVLGEFVGIEIESARIFKRHMWSSIIRNQYPGIDRAAQKLARTTGLPFVSRMRRFSREMLRVMSLQGEVVRYGATVLAKDGSWKQGTVVRVGPFEVIVGGDYLEYLPGYNILAVSARRPGKRCRMSARTLFGARRGQVGFCINPQAQ